MPSVSSISDDVSKNKTSIAKAAVLGSLLAITGVKFFKWAKKEIKGE